MTWGSAHSPRPDDNVPDMAVLIDQEGLREAGSLVTAPADCLCRVEQRRQVQLILGIELLDRLPSRVDTDRQHLEIAVLEGLVQRHHCRHLVDTRLAPGGPEVQEDELAPEVAEMHELAIRIFQFEVGRDGTDRQVSAPAAVDCEGGQQADQTEEKNGFHTHRGTRIVLDSRNLW